MSSFRYEAVVGLETSEGGSGMNQLPCALVVGVYGAII